jgi:hypothetical protein
VIVARGRPRPGRARDQPRGPSSIEAYDITRAGSLYCMKPVKMPWMKSSASSSASSLASYGRIVRTDVGAQLALVQRHAPATGHNRDRQEAQRADSLKTRGAFSAYASEFFDDRCGSNMPPWCHNRLR